MTKNNLKMVKNDQIKSKMSFFEKKWSWKWPTKYGQVWLGLSRSKLFFRVHPKDGPKLQFLVKNDNFRIKMTKNGQIVTVKNDHDLIEMILSQKWQDQTGLPLERSFFTWNPKFC